MEKILKSVGFVAIIVLAVWITLKFAHRVDEIGQVQQEQFLHDTVQHFEQYISKNNELIVSQNVQIGTLQDALRAKIIKAETLEKANIKKASLIVSLKSKIEILNTELTYTPDDYYVYDTIIYDENTYLQVPLPFKSSLDKWVSITGIVEYDKVTLSNLTIQQNPTFGLGYQSRGFFRSPTPVVFYSDKNPYITPLEMQNVQIVQNVPWYKTPTAHRVEGMAMGIALIKLVSFLAQ